MLDPRERDGSPREGARLRRRRPDLAALVVVCVAAGADAATARAEQPGAPALAAAPAAASDDDDSDLSDLSLEQLMEIRVETATREPQPVREAPAILSVITRDDIRAWGFQSVAEALVLVPGMYCIDDYLTADCGVRGVTGGQRGYSKVLKVMIDGQPVGFRPDGTSFLGPEMIPIEVVERIEVVRGPVSALYGANAFFGAINVITRRSDGETALGARVRIGDERGVRVAGAYVGGGDGWSATAGVTAVHARYDGRALPGSSPEYGRYAADDNLTARDAVQRPMSAFGRVGLRRGPIEVEAAARYGMLDSVAEFLDFGQLTHENRVALRSLDARVLGRYTPIDRVVVTASVGGSDGRPSDDEHLSTGAAASFPRRRFGSRAVDALLEGRLRLFGDDDWLSVGLDWSRDREELIEILSVDRQTGTETLTSNLAGEKTLSNAGVYVQAIVHPLEQVGLTGNVRYDHHNVYGSAAHYRVGAVVTPMPELSIKLLYGTSFKAPSALELYAQPLFPGEVVGNPDLHPENARLIEAEALWRPRRALSFALSGFVSQVRDKVELVPIENNTEPTNVARQDGWGVEAEARWAHGHHAVAATAAYQHTDTAQDDPFQGELVAPSDRYPALVEQLRWTYRDPTWGAPAVALRYVSQRRASSFNIRDHLQQPYALPRYVTLDLVYGRSWGKHTVELRLDNLLDADDAEPGFGGVDLPATGRHGWLSYSYDL
jgi:outer membrane cobalamin receptor